MTHLKFDIVCISELRGHELPSESRVEELKNDLKRRGLLIKPIVVDRNTMVILDGHCRCDALKRLGCSKVAVRFVDYSSKEIDVESWNGERITKEEVVEAGLSGKLMRPKTSRHIIRNGGRRVHISKICENALVPIEKLS